MRACLMVVLVAVGCGSENPRPVATDAPAGYNYGSPCGGNSDCTGDPDRYCALAGTCTTRCRTHSDCGCSAGTTDADLASGTCRYGCIAPTSTLADRYCLKRCADSTQCHGALSCRPQVAGFNVCSP